MSPAKQIVVLGGGFTGLHLVRRLEGRLHRGEASVTLIDRQNYHLFTPLLYQVCTGELPPHAVAYPLRDATAPAGFQFLQSEVTAIDLERRRVGTADGEVPYDHLVIALGSVTNDYGIPGVRENALPVKWLSDAEALKRHVLDIFESAAIETDIARRHEQLTFIIVGAGPVGVELASSLRVLMDHTLRRIYPSIDFYSDVTIHLLDTRKVVRHWLLRRMQPCREMVPLMSESLERQLGLIQLLKLRLHLLVCTWCARYFKQIKFLRRLVRLRTSTSVKEKPSTIAPALTAEGRERISKSLRQSAVEIASLNKL